MDSAPGRFIVFEGLNGCGKSTQVLLTYDALCARGYDVVQTKEPGNTELGEGIRSLLLTDKSDRVDLHPLAELFLFSADRVQHIEQVITPNLTAGKVILCDRCYPSTIAYQGFAGGLDLDTVEDMIDIAVGDTECDLIFWIDVEPKICYERLQRSGNLDRIEGKPLEYHERAYEGYKTMHRSYDNMLRIDGSMPPEEVNRDIMGYLSAIL